MAAGAAVPLAPLAATVQSGCPGIGGVVVPYTQSRMNAGTSLRPEISAARAMKSSVLADRPA